MTFQTPFFLQPGFMVVHGNRLEDLRDLVVSFVKDRPLPPLQPEVFLVQSNGMKHWLEAALADEDALGICAATQMALPSAFIWQVYRAVLGVEAVPLHMPFDKSALLWRLMRLLPQLAQNDPVCQTLARYLQSDSDGRKLFQLAQQVADVFDGYQSYRADWLTDWANGRDVLRASPNQSSPLPEDQLWQAQVWRSLVADVGSSQAQASRSAVHEKFMQKIQSHSLVQRPEGLPQRVVVFGISSLPMQAVQALSALGRFCQVLMVVQNPCRHYWGHIVDGRSATSYRPRQASKCGKPVSELPTAAAELHAQAHPLLASWGKQGRDYLHLLDAFDQPESYLHVLPKIEVFEPPQAHWPNPLNQLQQLQLDILELEPLPQQPEPLPVNNGAIKLITAHSAQREVEILHDQLLAWFDEDSTLQARDVIVMVPDMEQFAPHIHAVFGRFSVGQSRHIPYSVADTSTRATPLIQALELLLGLPTSRISLADWLSLFEVAAVRKRFDLQSSEVRVLQLWLMRAGVRWGLDADHRKAWGVPEMPGMEQNTWAFGLRRLLLGYASAQSGAWQGVHPLPEVGGLSAQMLGALAQWIEAMQTSLNALAINQSPNQWGATLQALLAQFFLASDDAEERLLAQLQLQLQRWLELCGQAELNSPLPLVVVREHWLGQIETPGLHQRFLGGGVQFATLMPMRAIPFRVVCLLGMNDKDYPRSTMPRDFDLMTRQWREGDRSRREDDRYLFLEALLSAREKFYISWQGHRATDNTPQPASVLVSQLLDVLRARYTDSPEIVAHPLQAFSARYFQASSGLRTYALDWQQAMALGDDPKGDVEDARIDKSHPTEEPELVIDIQDLQDFLRHPVNVYWRHRLNVRLIEPEAAVPEEEPFALDGLTQFQLGQTLLQSNNLQASLSQLEGQGLLPMGAFGRQLGHELLLKAKSVQDRAAPWLEQFPQLLEPQDIQLHLDGFALTGVLREIRQGDKGYLQLSMQPGAVTHGKGMTLPRWDKWISLWAAHVLFCASGQPLQTVLCGIDGQTQLPSLSKEQAIEQLSRWLRAYLIAWQSPLPLALRTGLAYLETLHVAALSRGKSSQDTEPAEREESVEELALTQAQLAFEGGYALEGDRLRSAYLQRSFQSFDDIAAEMPKWAVDLYGGLVRHVGIIAHEQQTESSEGART